MAEISRRKFLEICCSGVTAFFPWPQHSLANYSFLDRDRNPRVETVPVYRPLSREQAIVLVDTVINIMGNLPYSMQEGRHCSSFVGLILEQMGYPIYRFIDFSNNNQQINSNNPAVTQPFPNSNTVAQMERFSSLNEALQTNLIDYNHSIASVETILPYNTPPGSLFYFRKEGETHNGINAYYHVAICLGQDENKVEFADFGPGMSGPQRNRSFEQVAIGVYGGEVYQLELNQPTNTSSNNNITVVDAHRLLWEWQQTIEYQTYFP